MDPNPIKHTGAMMKKIRLALEPALAAAGFEFDVRNKPHHMGDPVWLDYARPSMLLRIEYEQRNTATLTAAILDESAGHRIVVATSMNESRSPKEVLERMDRFIAGVVAFLSSLPQTTG